jgi:hypothetical protein
MFVLRNPNRTALETFLLVTALKIHLSMSAVKTNFIVLEKLIVV